MLCAPTMQDGETLKSGCRAGNMHRMEKISRISRLETPAGMSKKVIETQNTYEKLYDFSVEQ